MNTIETVSSEYQGVEYHIPVAAITELLDEVTPPIPHSEDNKTVALDFLVAASHKSGPVEPMEYLVHGLAVYQVGLHTMGYYKEGQGTYPHNKTVEEYMEKGIEKGYEFSMVGTLFYNPQESALPLADKVTLLISNSRTGETAQQPLEGLAQWNKKLIDKALVEMYLNCWYD